jgi:FtsP/CotA-like multicopper oxidase with cupredoxin domain
MHIHSGSFQVLEHVPFDVDAYWATGKVTYTGEGVKPVAWQAGFKDVVQVPVGHVTRVRMPFDFPGLYMFHCEWGVGWGAFDTVSAFLR